jgi:hypothetical protein
VKTNERGNCVVIFKDNTLGKWVDCRHGNGAYGGTWIENAVQAVARDLFAAAMPRLEAAGFPIVLHVHDEIVCEIPKDFGDEEEREFLRLMLTLPAWAEGLPLNAKVRVGDRFCKAKAPIETAAESPNADDLGFFSGPHVEFASAGPNDQRNDANTANDNGHEYQSGEREWGNNVDSYIYRDAAGNPYLQV